MTVADQPELAQVLRRAVASGYFSGVGELLAADAVLDTSNESGRRRIAGREPIGHPEHRVLPRAEPPERVPGLRREVVGRGGERQPHRVEDEVAGALEDVLGYVPGAGPGHEVPHRGGERGAGRAVDRHERSPSES